MLRILSNVLFKDRQAVGKRGSTRHGTRHGRRPTFGYSRVESCECRAAFGYRNDASSSCF
jgi:hypothetical protein